MIAFLQPFALVALVAAAIPTLLHLLGRRLPPTVVFPAVRYLTATEREHSRRLRFRNLLLLILRTAAIVFLVLAAAQPVTEFGSGETHPPTAIALVVDNSLSSGVVVEGHRALDTIVATAREVIAHTGVGDRLWLVLADGIPLRKTRLEAIETLDGLSPSSARLDLGAAVRVAARAVQDDPLEDGAVVVVSDLQATALSLGPPVETRVIAWSPPPVPQNRWLDSAYSEPAIWAPRGGVVASVDGFSERPAALRLRVAGLELAKTVASPGDRVVLLGTLPREGWTIASVELDPDEMRTDDRRMLALFRAEPAGVRAAPDIGGFLEEALSVLQEGGRTVVGDQVSLGSVSALGVSVVFPPSDPALVGALNRTLSGRSVDWQFEDVVHGEWELSDESGLADGSEVFRRYRLSGNGPVYATVNGDPWLVRSGDVVVVASRMEPDWTRLPVSAAFVPFVDLIINRIAAEEAWIVRASPGDVVELPTSASTVLGSSSAELITVPADRRVVAPPNPGVYFLRSASGDTVGALEVNGDPRESRLRAADPSQVRASFGDESRIVEASVFGRELFRGAGRTSLTGFFLVVALLAVLGEFVVASSGGQARTIS